MFIYLLYNTVNSKQYVGKYEGKYLKKRLSTHFCHARMGFQSAIARAIRKHGAENFRIHPLMSTITDRGELCRWEQELIALMKTKAPNGYNLTDGGDGTVGWKASDETRRNMRNAQLGKRFSIEHCRAISESRTGKPHPWKRKTA